MRSIQTLLLFPAILAVVFVEAATDPIRQLTGAQVDLLPGLIVFTSLSADLKTLAFAAVFGGICYDSFSANPMGISILPLFLTGFVVYRNRTLILRDQAFAQMVLGLAASAAVPVMTLISLWGAGEHPLVGWVSLWQWLVMTVVGGFLTPVFFWGFDRLHRAVDYQPAHQTAFRTDREIKRGRL